MKGGGGRGKRDADAITQGNKRSYYMQTSDLFAVDSDVYLAHPTCNSTAATRSCVTVTVAFDILPCS